MTTKTRTEAVGALERAKGELYELSRTTEGEIELVARTFEGLAGQMDTVLALAAEIVGCVEGENVSSVLPKVQVLGTVARQFIGDRLQATSGILDTVTKEVTLLRQLSQVTRGQSSIALETKALSVLTNIEVARLGAVGAGFEYLAHELAEFSRSVSADTRELAGHADGRQAAIEETRRVLAAEIPRLREEFARIEGDLGSALSVVDSHLTQLSQLPVEFRSSVKDVAQQIAGVVAAVQAHDITRQQIEHVQEGFGLISAEIGRSEDLGRDFIAALARAYAGLTIQIYQLKTTRETIAGWASQIRDCTSGILQVSAADVVGIGPRVLEQERELSSQFARIERLESESQSYSKKIQRTFGGLSNLTQFVSEHLEKSASVREHLQLLTFNSIIEASGLGTQAAAILAIAQCIKGISMEWGRITDQSSGAMQAVLNLEKQANQAMDAFSEASNARLREAQGQAITGLDNLRTAAAFAADRAQEMRIATESVQAKTSEVTSTVDQFDGCFGRIDAVLNALEEVRRQLETDHPEVKQCYEEAEVEQLFSASYTTEMEREVLHAALRGTDLPVAQQTFAGNDVELF
jgi:hypothetical protein